MESTVMLNDFVYRQDEGSRFSHFKGDWRKFLAAVVAALKAAREEGIPLTPGDKDGSIWVIMDPERFMSAIVPVSAGAEMSCVCEARRTGEAPVIVPTIKADKVPALYARVLLFSKELLGDDAVTEADFEIIAIEASPTAEPTPPHPVTMARNTLGKEGGTITAYLTDGYAEAVWFWATHAHVATR